MKKLWVLLAALAALLGCADDGTVAEPLVSVAEASSTTCATCSNSTPAQKVILVHGRNDTSARWNTLVSNWSSKGYTENTNLFRIDLTSYCGDNDFCSVLSGYSATYVNESYALCLQAYINEKVPCDADAGTCPDVDIVSHSQGGVVSRYYARFLAGSGSPARNVNDMVNMASPHNGITNCALAGSCTGVNPEDCPDSNFLHKLNGVSPQGDGSNDETPGGSATGPVHYSATVSKKDTVVPPWCGGYYMANPQTQQGDDYNCTSPNYTLDADADSCTLTSGLHLTIPTNTTAINDAYCKVTTE